METLTWQEVLNNLQNLTPEQLNQPASVIDTDGDAQHFYGMMMETWRTENGDYLSVPVLEF